jgi:hypothetical protein
MGGDIVLFERGRGGSWAEAGDFMPNQINSFWKKL